MGWSAEGEGLPDTGNNVHKMRNTPLHCLHTCYGAGQSEQREENVAIVQTMVEQKPWPWQVERR